MKNRLIVAAGIFVLTSAVLAGCTKTEPVAEVPEVSDVVSEIAESEIVSELESEVISEIVSEEPKIDPNEELTWQFLEVDEDWYKTYEGMGLKRDGKLYSLSDGIPLENWEMTGLCVRHGTCATPGGVGDKNRDRIISDDRFVIPYVTGEDDLAWYGKPVTTLTLIPMSFYGYTIPVFRNGDSIWIVKLSGYDSYDELTLINN